MKEIPGKIESWITVRSSHSVKDLLNAQSSETAVTIEVVDLGQMKGRGQIQVHMRGGVSGRWDGGNPEERSMLHFAIEMVEDQELYRIYYLTNRFGESLGIIHATEHGGKTPDDYLLAKDALQRILREDTIEDKWEPFLIEVPE